MITKMKTNSPNNICNKEDYKMCGLGSKNKYFEESHRIDEYRCRCKDEALDLLKEHFYALWD